jgi:hypothetical protein
LSGSAGVRATPLNLVPSGEGEEGATVFIFSDFEVIDGEGLVGVVVHCHGGDDFFGSIRLIVGSLGEASVGSGIDTKYEGWI